MNSPYHILITWLTLFLIWVQVPAHGQGKNARFKHLTTEDGLPQNMVDCMLQDSHGFMWFGTWNGVCRYDGYDFELFEEHRGTADGIRTNFIHALQEDQFGNIWIGTKQGLQVYLYDQHGFKNIEGAIPNLTGNTLPDIRTLELHQDSILLVGSDHGVTFLNIQNERGQTQLLRNIPFGIGSFELRGSLVNAVMSDHQHRIWVGTDEGLVLYASDATEVVRFSSGIQEGTISSNQILSIYETQDREIWIGTEAGLNYLNLADRTFKQFWNEAGDPNSLVHNTVMDIAEDRSGQLVIATLGGLSLMDRKIQEMVNYTNEFNVNHSLSNDFVNSLLRDDMGNIWIGTERGGVNFLSVNQNRIEHFEFKPDDPNSLSHSTVNSVYEDQDYLWIGTAGGGLNRYNKSREQFKAYMNDPEDPASISSDFITDTHRDRKGQLWIGTWGAGLDIFHSDQGIFEHHQSGTRPGLVSNFVSSIAEDVRGNLWIGTLGGLVRYDLESDTFETLFGDKNEGRITQVGCLMFDDRGNLWVGTRYGLYRIERPTGNPDNAQITRYEHNQANAGTISGDYVISMHQDIQGRLWFGTYGQGLNLLKQSGDSTWFEHFTSTDGLSNTIIYSMEEDAYQTLWLSTDYGLSRLDPATGRIRNFYIADGLLNNQYYWSASHKNAAGKLYFGGMNGLDAFYPDWIKEEVHNPKILITDIKLLNESVIPGREYHGVEVLTESLHKADQITLSYKEMIFGIEFSSLNYQEEPGMIRYAYILEGLEQEWNYVSSGRRYASYTNLKPGDYTFKVKASASNGEFLAEAKSIDILIAPPFWDTPWFRGVVLLSLIGLVIGYIRFRTYSLKKQKISLERQVIERTERINQQNEALSFQAVQLRNNNHELEEKQKLIEGQNQRLEQQNREILSQRDELITLNKKVKLVSQLKLSFFTNISHEFRTPLTLIIGPLDRLIKEHNFDQEVKNTLNVMQRNAHRLLHLINQVMDFRKIEKGRMELKVTEGSISDFCKNLFKAFEPLAEIRHMKFDYQESGLPEQVWFDMAKLENVLYNLLSNAFKYTPEGGEVNMEVRGLRFSEARLAAQEEFQDENATVISVRIADTGIGISNEHLPLVFKRFYRIESEEAFRISGSGIGLALTEELIKTHHGEIFVNSKPDEGSVFEIQFPCLKGSYSAQQVAAPKQDTTDMDILQQIEVLKNELKQPEAETTDLQQETVLNKEKSTILVVEDSVDLRTFITHRLSKNYNVLEAENGQKGLALANKHAPDIIISDVMMPEMDGLELCASIKGSLSTSHIPVILLTAKSAVEDQLEGLQIGADDYLPKPFNFEVLEAKVQNFIETHKRLRHLFLESAEFNVNEATTNAKDQKFLQHAIEVVEESMDNSDFGVKEFVEAMGISRSLLHKKLTHLTDQSAAEFINHLRMKKGRELLRQNEWNISEVAYAIGYNDPKYFSRVFSKHFGQSPKEFLETVTA